MKKPCLRLCLAVIFGFALAAGGIPSLYAQQSDTDEFELEEITVTAQKRAQNLQKVPIQMEVISGEDLLGTGKDNVDDILRDVANVLINKNVDGMRITLRGLADDGAFWHDMNVSTPTVAVNIDGAYNSSSSAGQNLFDVERVEVLAGPQSTLYGSNSPGGIVNVVTAAPKTDKYAVNASAEFGSFGLFDGQVMVNAPIIKDLLAMRLAAQAYNRDSWIDGSDNSQDTKTARLKTLVQPSDTFSAIVTVSYSESISGGRLGGNVRVFDYEDGQYEDGTPVTNPWTADPRGGGPPPGPPPGQSGPTILETPDQMQQNAETLGFQAEIDWDTAIGTISFVPYYNEKKSSEFRDDVEIYYAGVPDPVYTSQYGENHTEQQGADLRVASPEDFPFVWIIGGTYFESDRADFRDDLYFDANDTSNNTTQENKALYVNATYPITEKFRGTVGYRYSWDEVGNVEKPPKVGDGVSGQKYSNPDYKVGIEYDLAEDTLIYANWATSYRINAMANAQGDENVPPEELTSYTVGAKNRFFDNKLQVNASAFFYDYKNKRFRGTSDGRFGRGAVIRESDYPHDGLPGTDFNNDGDYVDTNLNPGDPGLQPGESSDLFGMDLSDPWGQQDGAQETIGVDISADWLITSNDRLRLQLSYLDATWKDATINFYWSWIWDDEGKSFNGKRTTYSSKWSAHASYSHQFDLGSWGTLLPSIDIQYKSDYYLSFDEEDYPYNYQEGYYLLNGSVTFNHSSGKWSLNAYVKNATEYAAKTFWQNPAGSATLGISDPRQYGAVVSVKF